MKTNLYELTNEEAILVEGLRQGQVILDDQKWFMLSEKEREVVELWRIGQYGEMIVRFVEGEPKISKVFLEFLHGHLSEGQTIVDLLPTLRSKFSIDAP